MLAGSKKNLQDISGWQASVHKHGSRRLIVATSEEQPLATLHTHEGRSKDP
jgi:hypothetical protein